MYEMHRASDDVVVAQEVAGTRVHVGGAVDAIGEWGAAGHALDHVAELGGVDGGAELEELGDLLADGGIRLVNGDEVARLEHFEEVRLLEGGGEVLLHLLLDRAETRVVAQGGHYAVGVRLGGGVRRGGRGDGVGVEDGGIEDGEVGRRGRGGAGGVVRRLLLLRRHGGGARCAIRGGMPVERPGERRATVRSPRGARGNEMRRSSSGRTAARGARSWKNPLRAASRRRRALLAARLSSHHARFDRHATHSNARPSATTTASGPSPWPTNRPSRT